MALPLHVLASAETPRDLLRAVTFNHAPVGEDVGVVSPVATAGSPAPAAASTLIDALDWHVGATPERTHIRILDESGGADDVTYAALHREAAAVAAGLLARDVMPGDTVAIMLPTSRAYFVTFAGVVLAGAVPVPIYPPARPSRAGRSPSPPHRHSSNARAAMLVTVPEAVGLGHLLRANVDSIRHVVVPESLAGVAGRRPAPTTLRRPRAGAVHVGQHRPAQGRRAHARQPAGQHPRDGRGRGGVGGGHVRQLAAAVSRHGSDRRVARQPLLRGPAGGDGAAAVPDRARHGG